MFRPIAISLSPNTSLPDYFLAVWSLFQPWKWQSFQKTHQLEAEFQKRFGFQETVALDSGRAGLYLALKMAGAGKGDEVLIQSFTCLVVPAAVIWTGARPVYVDIDKTLNLDPKNLETKITPKTKAVIVQHTFGYPAQMQEILRIAQKYRILIIEDCAHCLGAKYQGRALGTLGDIAVFSFGRDKVISSVFGGLVAANRPDLAAKLKKIKSQLRPIPRKLVFQGLFHPVVFSLILPFYNKGHLGKGLAVISQKLGLFARVISPCEKRLKKPAYLPARLSSPLAGMALFQLKRLERFNNKREKIAEFYKKELNGLKSLEFLPKPRPRDKAIYLRLGVLVQNRDKFLRRAAQRGIYLGDWYWPVIAPGYMELKKLGYQKHSTPRAEQASRKILNLPTYPALTIRQAQKVVNLIKDLSGNKTNYN
jgi:dTDP-4-amino-4,6-dideoxygalactose transaminase